MKSREWLRSSEQRRKSRRFLAEFVRNPDGTFTLVPESCVVKMQKNQFVAEWVDVDAKALASEMNEFGITLN